MAGTEQVTEAQPSIIVEYKNERPVDLLDLTASLAAFGEEFKNFAAERGDGSAPRLVIHEMRVGSIIAELIPWLERLDFLFQYREYVGSFMTNWQDLLQRVLNLSDNARAIPKPTLRNIRNFVSATAKDNASQLNIVAQDNATRNIVINNIILQSPQAATIARNASYLLARDVPAEEAFAGEPLTLFQMRDAKVGDMGYIDRFSEKPVKLTFASEQTKNSILHHSENPWHTIFFVSGVVKTSAGQVAAFHIRSLDAVAPKDAA